MKTIIRGILLIAFIIVFYGGVKELCCQKEKANLCIDLAEYTIPPAVAGYERFGYIEEYPALDSGKVEELLESISDDKKKAVLQYILDKAYFTVEAYEDYKNTKTRDIDRLHNGDTLHTTFCFSTSLAEENNISFDNIFMSFDVEGLPEETVKDWSTEEEMARSAVLTYVRSLGGDANTAVITNRYENDADGRYVDIKVSYFEGEDETFIGYYGVDLSSFEGEDEMRGGPIIKFYEYF